DDPVAVLTPQADRQPIRGPAGSGRVRDPPVGDDRRRHLLRDLDHEGRSGLPVRLDPDPSVDPADELTADIEAEPGPADAPLHVRIEAIELLEDPPLLRRRNAEALVADREADVPVARLERERDRAAARRVLDRVLEQVREHLPQL